MAKSAMALARAKARRRNRDHIARSAASDITVEQELAMRRKARKCPMCGTSLTGKPGLPNSKHLDHIIPVASGGTHTHGNVRIICSRCNLRRPKDGSDYTGPVTLWAVLPGTVARPHGGANKATCRKGLHPWTPENIEVRPDGGKRCRPCRKETDRQRNQRRRGRDRGRKPAPRKTCTCGAPFAAPGRTAMCPDCTDKAARRAADLHASGMTWRQVAAEVGYHSYEGARFAAKRIGYAPHRRADLTASPVPIVQSP